MKEITSANMVGISAGTNNFIKYYNLQLLKLHAASLVNKSSDKNETMKASLEKENTASLESPQKELNRLTKKPSTQEKHIKKDLPHRQVLSNPPHFFSQN